MKHWSATPTDLETPVPSSLAVLLDRPSAQTWRFLGLATQDSEHSSLTCCGPVPGELCGSKLVFLGKRDCNGFFAAKEIADCTEPGLSDCCGMSADTALQILGSRSLASSCNFCTSLPCLSCIAVTLPFQAVSLASKQACQCFSCTLKDALMISPKRKVFKSNSTDLCHYLSYHRL